MAMTGQAAHVLSSKYPELTRDDVSRYVSQLKEKLGPTKAAAVYSTACRAAPIADNPLGLHRGSVVEIEKERYLALGCGFMSLEFASLSRPGTARTIGSDEFMRLGDSDFRVLSDEESKQALEEVLAR